MPLVKSEGGSWRAFRSFLAEGRAVMPCNRRHLVTWWPCIRCSTGLSSLLISIFVNRINESSEKRWVQMSYRDDNIAFTRWKWSFHRMDRSTDVSLQPIPRGRWVMMNILRPSYLKVRLAFSFKPPCWRILKMNVFLSLSMNAALWLTWLVMANEEDHDKSRSSRISFSEVLYQDTWGTRWTCPLTTRTNNCSTVVSLVCPPIRDVESRHRSREHGSVVDLRFSRVSTSQHYSNNTLHQSASLVALDSTWRRWGGWPVLVLISL